MAPGTYSIQVYTSILDNLMQSGFEIHIIATCSRRTNAHCTLHLHGFVLDKKTGQVLGLNQMSRSMQYTRFRVAAMFKGRL